jgi:hypothetical protein
VLPEKDEEEEENQKYEETVDNELKKGPVER